MVMVTHYSGFIITMIIINIYIVYFPSKLTLKLERGINIHIFANKLKIWCKALFFLEFGLIVQHCIVFDQNT